MKPGEFDDLLRQKFDQNDFEYNARNWDRLAEELEGRGKKRGLLLWWIPLMGVAASVALAFGFTSVIREGAGIPANLKGIIAGINQNASAEHTAMPVNINVENALSSAHPVAVTLRKNNNLTAFVADEHSGDTKINIQNALSYKARAVKATTDLDIIMNAPEPEGKKKKAVRPVAEGLYTFKEHKEEPKKMTRSAIILSGGVSYGNQTSGYTIGATGRRMINSKLYVESDIAFVGSNNTQKVFYLEKGASSSGGGAIVNGASARVVNAKTSSVVQTPATTDDEVIKSTNHSYNLYYAQVTPSIGYKVMKHLSLGVGPDFQQMLVDNRPAASTVDRGNITEAPMFDVGFMGKMEYAISGNLKAAVFYREGINNIITPTNTYIDRNYLQFQVKYSILNR